MLGSVRYLSLCFYLFTLSRKVRVCTHPMPNLPCSLCAVRAGSERDSSLGPRLDGTARSGCRSERAAVGATRRNPRHQARPHPKRGRVTHPRSTRQRLLRRLPLRRQRLLRWLPLRRRRRSNRRLRLLTRIKRSTRRPHLPPLTQTPPAPREPKNSCARSRALTPRNSWRCLWTPREPMQNRSP